MRKTLTIILMVISSFAIAETDPLKIEYTDFPIISENEIHLYLSDGRVGRLSKDREQIDIAQHALNAGMKVLIDLDTQSRVLSISLFTHSSLMSPIEKLDGLKELSNYEPTILPNMITANNIFKRMNRGWQQESQCFNRAHVWNYEEFKRSGLLSKKVFIFFTRRYIRNYNFFWWFHAVPTVLVNHNGKVLERALDPRYVKSPLPMKTWSDVFVKSKRQCPVVTKYSTYRDNQQTEDCYFHFSSMYYLVPSDLDNFERTGFEKKSFIQSEITEAYREAF